MEREFLSVETPGGENAAVLCRAISHGRDQLHVLPDAEREAAGGLGSADAVALQADVEGAPPHHPRQPAEKLRRARQWLLPRRGVARRQARRAALSAAAESQKRSRAPRRVSRRAAA